MRSSKTGRTSICIHGTTSMPIATGWWAGWETSGTTWVGTRRTGRCARGGLMGAYVLRRLLQAVPLLWLISVMVFLLLHVIPGGPMAAYENNPDMTAEDQQRLEHDLGLDVPLHVQYVRWLAALLHGDWGYSLASKRPVLVEIGDRLPNTVYLIGVATLVTLVLAVPIGIFSALRQYSTLDHVVTTVAFMGHSIPIFWFGLILIIVFHVTLRNPWPSISPRCSPARSSQKRCFPGPAWAGSSLNRRSGSTTRC